MRKNVASQVVGAQLIAKADGTPITTGTTTCYVLGDGGTQAAGSVGSGACTHEGNGFWTYAPAQGETNYDHVAFTFVNTNAINVTVQVYPNYPQTGDSYARIGAPVGASISADIAGVQSDTDNIQTRIPAALVSGRIDASVGAMAANVLTSSAINTGAITTAAFAAGAINAAAIAADAIGASELAADAVAEIADAVWDEVLSGHLTSGTTGAGLNAAGSAGDPWATALPGAYGAGSAGKIVGDNLNAASSTLATAAALSTVAGYVDTEVAAIKAKTDQLTFTTSNRVDAQVFGIQAGAITATAIAADAITDAKVASDVTIASVTGAVGSVTANVNADVKKINGVTIAGDGSATPFHV